MPAASELLVDGRVQGAVFRVRAAGILYSVGLANDRNDLDWLDVALLEIVREPRLIRELIDEFPLPERFVDYALNRLIERNLILIDVHRGAVVKSSLPATPALGEPKLYLFWQDHASGMLFPLDHVRAWDVTLRQGSDDSARIVHLPSPHLYRTPFEISDAELLYRVQRFLPEVTGGSVVCSRARVRTMCLEVRGSLREDGRLGIREAIPWALRAAWARLPGIAFGEEPRGEERVAIPLTWDEVVGEWRQETQDRIVASSASRQSFLSLARYAEAESRVEIVQAEVSIAKQLAREARRTLVVAVSGKHGSVGDAVQILSNAATGVEKLLIAPGDLRPAKREEYQRSGIRVLMAGRRQVADFVLIDGLDLVVGGPGAASSIVVRSATPLEPFCAWISSLGGEFRVPEPGEAPGVVQELRVLDRELGILLDEPLARGSANVTDNMSTRLELLRQQLTDRCSDLQATLTSRRSSPIDGLTLAEVEAVLQGWAGSLRVVALEQTSALGKMAVARGFEAAVWPNNGGPADLIILERAVIIGFHSPDAGEDVSSPDFIAVADEDLASRLRHITAKFPRIT